MRILNALALISILAGCTPSPIRNPVTPTVHPPRFLDERVPVSFVPPNSDVGVLVLSPDRTQVAYSIGHSGIRKIYFGPIAGDARRERNLDTPIKNFQWLGSGAALVYEDQRVKEFPGEFVDWNIPRTQTLAYRLMRLPLDGGTATMIAEIAETYGPSPPSDLSVLPIDYHANPKNEQVAYMATNFSGYSGPLWLAGGDGTTPTKVDDGENYSDLTWSPDGTKLAYSAMWSTEDGPAEEVRVLDVGTGKVQLASTTPLEVLRQRSGSTRFDPFDIFLVWKGDSHQLQMIHTEEGALFRTPVMRIKTYEVGSGLVTTDTIDLSVPGVGAFKFSGFMPSPDGTQLLCFRGGIGRTGETVVLSLSRHTVTVLGQSVGLRGWLDNQRVLYSEGTGLTPGVLSARVPEPSTVPASPTIEMGQ